MTSLMHELPHTIEQRDALDKVAKPLGRLAGELDSHEGLSNVLQGIPWLGHPLHPVLTDYPIGFWSSAMLLDLVGGERTDAAADTLIGFGIAAAVPTAAAGVAEYARVTKPTTRVATVHAMANSVALTLMTASFMARKAGNRRLGRTLSMVGSAAMLAGGYLGGHLTYGKGVGVEEDGSA
ncbi:MAG TPA: DUF2231 domain-containing protein [Actinomycetota bacterium]|nr:DUF2231 domain-containing protein [Actinomycetota bacterium]